GAREGGGGIDGGGGAPVAQVLAGGGGGGQGGSPFFYKSAAVVAGAPPQQPSPVTRRDPQAQPAWPQKKRLDPGLHGFRGFDYTKACVWIRNPCHPWLRAPTLRAKRFSLSLCLSLRRRTAEAQARGEACGARRIHFIPNVDSNQ